MFSDLTALEFKQIYLSGYRPVEKQTVENTEELTNNGSVDWISKGAVTGVKD